MSEPKGLGGRILQARLDLAARRGEAVTKQAIAGRMKVSGVTVGRWESGEKEPDLATIERLAQVLETTAAWLAFGVEVARPHMQNGDVPREKATPAERARMAETERDYDRTLGKKARPKKRPA